jgi:y4mF family transcriptional regulator
MDEESQESLADFVRQQRKIHKLTQQELADRAGVGIRFIRELEDGKPTLRMDKVNIVLDLFGHELGPMPCQRKE